MRWSREVLLAQLLHERYGDLERLTLECYDRTYLAPVPSRKPERKEREFCRNNSEHKVNEVNAVPSDRPEVQAGRRFLLMRGMADARPSTGGTWRRPQAVHVSVHRSACGCPNTSALSEEWKTDCAAGKSNGQETA